MTETTIVIDRIQNESDYQTVEVGQDYDSSLDAVIVHPTANPSLFVVSCRAKQCDATQCNELASKVCSRLIGEDAVAKIRAIDEMRFHDDKNGTYGVSTTVEVTLLNPTISAAQDAAFAPIVEEVTNDDIVEA